MINSNTTQSMTDANAEQGRKYARPDTVIDGVSAPFGPRSIEGHTEVTVASTATLEMVAATAGQYDAYVLAAYADPGLAAARGIAEVPVIGIAEASMLMACTVGRMFSIVTILPRLKPVLADLVRLNGLESRLASIRPTGLSVLEIQQDYDAAVERLVEAGRVAVEQDGAEVLLLGCSGFGPPDKRLEEALGVPVIDGCVAAVKLAESLYDYRLSTSRVGAYMRPEPKEYVGDVVPAIAAASDPAREGVRT
jgi:allantoin racemase